MADNITTHITNPNMLDWPALLARPPSFSLEDLAHYSTTSVDPYTVQIAQAVCAQFTFPGSGERTIEAAIGPETPEVVRRLAASQVGCVVLGIVGALNEYYHENAVASILDTLSKSTGIPDDSAPTKERWISLVRLYSGVLSRTEFAVLLETYTQLGRADRQLENASAVVVIEALQAMSRLCRGEEDGLQIFAGKDAGWMAAVAEWLFNLKLVVRASDNRVLYSNCGSDEEAVQLTIYFKDPGVPFQEPPMQLAPLTVKERGRLASGHMAEGRRE